MHKIIFFLTLFYFSAHTRIIAQWNEIYSDSIYNYISDIKFINSDTGFACGQLWQSPHFGIIFKTMNGGITWDTTEFSSGFWMMSLSIVNENIIYSGGQDGAVYKTIDGGQTWNWDQLVGGFDDLSTIYFLNQDTGFLIKFSNNIWKTIDGSMWNGQIVGGSSYFPNTSSAQFLNDSVGFIAKEKVFKTSDCGNSWQILNVDSNMPASCINMRNINDGIVIDLNGHVSRTTDGGNTFTPSQYIGPYSLYDCSFINDSIGYIVGGNDDFNWVATHFGGIIFKTTDGGLTWDSIQSFNHSIISLDFVNDSVGYAVGQGGKIYKITNANKVGIDDKEKSNDFVSFFPNPFSDFATLSVSRTQSKLYIYNSIGSLIMEEMIYNLNTKIERNALASGIYIYKVVDQNGISISGKFVIE